MMKKIKLAWIILAIVIALAVIVSCENAFITNILPSREIKGADEVPDIPEAPVIPDVPEVPETPDALVEMVWIPAGTFMMGSDIDESQHSVTLTKGFYMGKYQVTQEQYEAVMGSNPSRFKAAVAGESGTPGKLPVEQVSWYDAIVFCNKLSVAEGLSPVYSISGKTDPAAWGTVPTIDDTKWNAVVMDRSKNGYRLSTEAEWEYACRAGTTTEYNTGASISDNTGWYTTNSGGKTHQVGLKPANAWGLYDMHGNVWEWCWDWYKDDITTDTTDPTGAVSGTDRVHRGGSWGSDDQFMRSALRSSVIPSGRSNQIGFRLVRG
jgi:formylglycine-generating enzyme required for sulfatase activity